MVILPILLGCACVLVVTLYLQYRWRHRRVLEAASKLPCPSYLPLIGNSHHFIKDVTAVNKTITDMANRFKCLFCVWLGPTPLIVVSQPADLKVVLNNALEKDNTVQEVLQKYAGDGLIATSGPIGKAHRRLMTPVFHPLNLEKFIPQLNSACRRMVNDLLDESAKNIPIDPKVIIFKHIIDAATATIIGSGILSSEIVSKLLHLYNWVGRAIMIRVLNPIYSFEKIFNFMYKRELEEASQILSASSAEIDKKAKEYQERISSNTNDDDNPLTVMDIWYQQSSGTFQNTSWRDEINSTISAGSDTMVSSIGFLLTSLAANKDAQEKVYSEIQAVVGSSDEDLTIQDLNSLTYLEYAIYESLRLHGGIPIAGRLATKDFSVGGHTIPAGSKLLVTFHAMGWDPEVFPEPQKYNPDRFLTDSAQNISNIMPFASGPKNCIGKQYAMMLLKIAAVRIINKFKLSTSVKLEDIEYEVKIVSISKKPILIRFTPREITT